MDHDRSSCLHQLLERSASRTPDATAFIIGAKRYTYREVNAWAEALSRRLVAQGVRRGDRVGVCVERDIAMPVALAAILKAGAAYVPLDPSHPRDRLAYILEDARVACVVTKSSLSVLFAEASAPLVLVDRAHVPVDEYAAQGPAAAVAPDDLAYVIYTSGSTGRPKGVEIEHRNVVSLLTPCSASLAWRHRTAAGGHHAVLRHRRPRDLAAVERRCACRHRLAHRRARRRPTDGTAGAASCHGFAGDAGKLAPAA